MPDIEGYFYATGRRKAAVARIRLVPGRGDLSINGRALEQYFPSLALQAVIRSPLRLTDAEGKYDVLAAVAGGGVAGQAGAVRLGIARALLKVDAELRTSLKKEGFLTRDPRVKERRKYGLKKARKAPQFSKR
ncbi:MAG TPA: 30S ribosomal protein S9 [Clostridiales bacterium]|nr:30S ribosomal protein S9 [Clostridiales bacterium]